VLPIRFLSNIKVIFLPAKGTSQPQPLDLGIIHAFKCHYRKQSIHKTVAMTDRGLLHNVSQIKLDVLSATHFTPEAWRLVTPTTTKNCFEVCSFSIDHVSSNDDSVDEEDDWHS
jgi:hypothetical protein